MIAKTASAALPGSGRFSRWEWLLLAATAGGWTAWLLRAPGMLQGLDYRRYYFFNADWLRRSLLAGELPWWNPHVGLGRPFFADLQNGVLYPPNWLHLPLGVPLATVLLVWLHLIWAGMGMQRLGCKLGFTRLAAWWVAAAFIVAPALSARLVGGQIHYALALCFLPGLAWLLLRMLERPSARRIALLGAVSALQLLCGHPQIYWLTHLGLGLFAAGWMADRGWAQLGLAVIRLGAAMLLGLALTAPVLLPFFELIAESNRAQVPASLSAQGAMALHDWLALLVPPHDSFVPDIESQVLVGAPAVLMALVAAWRWRRERAVRALALLALGGAVLASAGPETFHRMLNGVVPGFAQFRLPSRVGVLVVFALFLLAGRWLSEARISRWVRLVAAALAFLALLMAAPALRRWYVLPAEYPAEPLVAGLAQELQRADPAHVPPRLNFSSRWVRENSGMVTGYSTFNGYVSLYLERVWEYVHAKAGLPAPETINTFPDVRIFERDPFLYDSMNLQAGFDLRAREMKLNPAPDPRAYLCFRAENAGDGHAAIRRMAQGQDFHRTALMESPPPALSGTGHGQASITAFANERVALRVEADAPAILVLAEAWYPGWTAEVSGAPAPAFPVNGWMRGVVVPAGKTEVVWRYRSRWFAAGCAIGAAALGLLLIALWRKQPEEAA